MAIVELQYLKDEDRITFSYTRDNKSVVEGSITFSVTPGYLWENTKCEFNFDKDNKLYIDEVLAIPTLIRSSCGIRFSATSLND